MSTLFPLTRIDQVAVVVRDLDAAINRYWKIMGIAPWRIYTYEPPGVQMTFRGGPGEYRMRLALAQVGDLTLELIQPLSEKNIYAEHLERKGEGLHHVGVNVTSLDKAVAEAASRGFSVIQSGHGFGQRGDGGYAYLDTDGQLGMIIELIERPLERRVPDAEVP